MRRAIWVNLLAIAFMTGFAVAQTRSSASVPISLRVPGSISLSLNAVPVSLAVAQGAQREFAAPLTVSWNLNPAEVPGFRVVAYFSDPEAAVVDDSNGASAKATQLRVRWGTGDFLPFASDASTTLFRTSVLSGPRRGSLQQTLSVKFADSALPTLPDGDYRGVLYLEVRNY